MRIEAVRVVLVSAPLPDNGIKWEDPPWAASRRGIWTTLLTPVMERPGQWANMGSFSKATASLLRLSKSKRGHLEPPPGRWEFRQCHLPTDGPRRATLFARYLGPDEARP